MFEVMLQNCNKKKISLVRVEESVCSHQFRPFMSVGILEVGRLIQEEAAL